MKAPTDSQCPGGSEGDNESLHPLLDSLEAGIQRLARDRDQLRETLSAVRSQLGMADTAEPKPTRTNRLSVGKPRRPSPEKTLPPLPTGTPDRAAKPPRPQRPALGRTLGQIRTPAHKPATPETPGADGEKAGRELTGVN